VEAEKMDLYPEIFSLPRAIEEVSAGSRPIIQKKDIDLNVNVAPELDRVTLDQPKFKQVLYNLVSNAVKFTDAGRKVEIRAAIHDHQHFELIVKDTGIGISPEDLPRLFKEFAQLEPGATHRYQGTGLGLALTRKIVELQKGKVTVDGEVGKGTCFTVVLPLVTGRANV
jgi:signal transduction histidine kinase